MAGAGAAGTAILELLLAAGAKDVVVFDQYGAVHGERDDLTQRMRWIADNTNRASYTGDLHAGLSGADVFIGVSAPNVINGADVATMAEGAIVFALANPTPEIDPEDAMEHAAVVATGRSDFANQINNVLAFPGVFRGLLNAQSRSVTSGMLHRRRGRRWPGPCVRRSSTPTTSSRACSTPASPTPSPGAVEKAVRAEP